MKLIVGATVLLLLLSGCSAPDSPDTPVAQQTEESSSAAPSLSESPQMEEPVESEPTETESEQASEPEATAEPTAQATSQAPQSPSASPSPTATATATATPSPTPTPTQTAVAGFTMTEVRQNNTASSCWVVVDGRVFDLTQWISRHPGGSRAIISLCGTDGTTSFNARHDGQSSPTATLESYDIGPLR